MSETTDTDKDQQQHIAPKAVAESAKSLGPRAVSKESLHKDQEATLTPDANKIKFTKNCVINSIQIIYSAIQVKFD